MKSWIWHVTILSAILGLLLAAAVRTEQRGFEDGAIPLTRIGQREAIVALQKKNLDYRKEILDLREKNTVYEANIASNQSAGKILNQQLQEMKVKAGLVPVEGPGVVVTLSDSKRKAPPGLEMDYIVHDMDVRTVMNELWLAGAEAMSINGQRVVLSTGVRCGGPTNMVNGVPVTAPFVIQAIGASETLTSALNMPGGAKDELGAFIGFEVKADEKVEIEAYSGSTQLKFAKPIEATKDEGKG